jgi:AAA15 family ATPase/GTPase
MFSSIKFRNFKSLKNFTVRLKPFNVLVGPNNAEKSTVLDAFRLLSAAIRHASRRNPTIINVAGNTHSGYDIDAMTSESVRDILAEISEALKSEVLSQHISNRMRHFSSRTAKDPSTIASEAIANLDKDWANSHTKFMAIPGKRVLTELNYRLQQKFNISITPTQILRNIDIGDIAVDLRSILGSLNQFAKS